MEMAREGPARDLPGKETPTTGWERSEHGMGSSMGLEDPNVGLPRLQPDLSVFLIGILSVPPTGQSSHLCRSVGCRGGGSQLGRSTYNCQCCSYISAGRVFPGTHQCL